MGTRHPITTRTSLFHRGWWRPSWPPAPGGVRAAVTPLSSWGLSDCPSPWPAQWGVRTCLQRAAVCLDPSSVSGAPVRPGTDLHISLNLCGPLPPAGMAQQLGEASSAVCPTVCSGTSLWPLTSAQQPQPWPQTRACVPMASGQPQA